VSYFELTNKAVTAAKNHQCCWCGESVKAGSVAQYRAYKFYGEFQADYLHAECYEAMRETDDFILEDGFFPGDFERGKVA
jgi:hypothetical protein